MEAIQVTDVTKSFKVFSDKAQSLKEILLFKNRSRYQVRQVLRGVSLQAAKGEAVGLIGSNGCGKSTLLKLMTKILYPDSGILALQGRVSSLLELGAGFHPDMSGRENIFMNASIFGLSKRETQGRIQAMIDFSELWEFMDNPVRTYSSGMYMRLAFAVAIHVDADILLIDEILGVGDAAFQAKCFQKLKALKAGGTTLVIVSHSLGQIQEICERSYWIKDGRVEKSGAPAEVHQAYGEFIGGV
jgi:ABC-2 type transport system ATP-binding protein